MAQGRLDIVLAEVHGRSAGNRCEPPDDLLGRLPDVLSAQVAAPPASPRPQRDVELPPFADEILAELDELVHPTDLVAIEALDDEALDAAATGSAGTSDALSVKRSEVHRLIDEVQEEIIGRYRSGSRLGRRSAPRLNRSHRFHRGAHSRICRRPCHVA